MYGLLKAFHFLAISLLVGTPAFYFFIWQPTRRRVEASVGDGSHGTRAQPAVPAGAMHDIGAAPAAVPPALVPLTWVGAALLVIAGAVDLVRAASQVIDPFDLGSFWFFVTVTNHGRLTLLRFGLAALFAVLATRGSARGTAGVGYLSVLSVLAVAIGTTISLTSHAGAKGGILPVFGDLVHLLAAGVWGGGLFAFATLPWKGLERFRATGVVFNLTSRFSNMGVAAVTALVVTGVYAATLHLFGLAALTSSDYGRTLIWKLAFFAGMLVPAAINLMIVKSRLRHLAESRVGSSDLKPIRHLKWLVRAEAVLLLGVLLFAGILTTKPPVDRPGTLSAPIAEVQFAGAYQVELRALPGENGRTSLTFRVSTSHGGPVPQELRLRTEWVMVEHDMGRSVADAGRVSPGVYRSEAVLAMSGRWQLQAHLIEPAGSVSTAVFLIDAPLSSAQGDGQVTFLSLYRVRTSLYAAGRFVVGILLVLACLLLLAAGLKGRVPKWSMPLWMLFLVYGLFVARDVLVVYGYPTMFKANPIQRTKAIVAQGQAIFQQSCAVCHGISGRGDGPAADDHQPRPADLTQPHMNEHWDGELYWWITNGIPGTAMPAFAKTLTEEERWTVIHYLRNLSQVRSAK